MAHKAKQPDQFSSPIVAPVLRRIWPATQLTAGIMSRLAINCIVQALPATRTPNRGENRRGYLQAGKVVWSRTWG